MKTLWKKDKEIRTNDNPNWKYKVYITDDETNKQLVESLATIDWETFLNRKILPNESEEQLALSLIKDENYIIGKRLVRFIRLIPNIRVIVCEFARLTPIPEPPMHIVKYRSGEPIVLDEKPEEKEKKPIKKWEDFPIKKGKIYV